MTDTFTRPSNTPFVSPSYELRPGVSFCRVAGRTMFLDVRADRYFCLSPNGDRSFIRLVDGIALDAEDRAVLDNLVVTGPLFAGRTAALPAPCPAIHIPNESFLDQQTRAPLTDIAHAASSVLAAPICLCTIGLDRTLATYRRRKSRFAAPCSRERISEIAAAFARFRYVATERDNCLTRSLAVASRLASAGAQPELVIAVKLQPFAAHAWVQCDGTLVNDRHEFVREFTPILVV